MPGMHDSPGPRDERHGARQARRFDPARAGLLDEADRFTYVDPARILELLAIPPGATVVDFGTGTGAYAIEIAERRPDASVVAVDEQPPMIALLRAKPRAARANLTSGGVELLAGLDATVDRVLALNVLHELGDAALAAMRALLRPDGRALVIDWAAERERPVGPPAGHVYARDEAIARLRGGGFVPHACDGFPYHHAFVCAPVSS